MTPDACRVAFDRRNGSMIGVTPFTRTHLVLARAMRLVTGQTSLVPSNALATRRHDRRDLRERDDRRRASWRWPPLRGFIPRVRAHVAAFACRSRRLLAGVRSVATRAHLADSCRSRRRHRCVGRRLADCVRLEGPMRHAHVVARGAIREHDALLAVHGVASTARNADARVVLERRGTDSSLRRRMAVVASGRGLARAEGMARETRRVRRRRPAMAELRLRLVAFVAHGFRGRRATIAILVALRACDLLRADVKRVHWRVARRLPGERYELLGRMRRRPLLNGNDHERSGESQRHDDECERTASLHGV